MPIAPPNAIFHTKTRFKNDKDPRKINLGIGAYRTNEGKPRVLRVVRKAEQLIVNDMSLNHEYLPITGDPGFCKAAQNLVFGQQAASTGNIATVQCLSGTGALRVGAEFLAYAFPTSKVFSSSPTWGNHATVFGRCRTKFGYYRYWDAKNLVLDINGMLADIRKAPRGSIFLLHACAHNPTGVDPTKEQWREICRVMKEKEHVTFFDTAYQGFASGSLEEDAYAIRYWYDQGMEMVIAQSFAKNLGLYNERAGAFHVVCKSNRDAKAAKSQIALIIRPMYSNPPAFGSRIVTKIVSDPKLFAEWKQEMGEMSGRIKQMRQLLFNALKKLGTPGNWDHILSQIGMFCFTGLTKKQCNYLMDNRHVYLLTSGRISIPGITPSNVQYLAESIDYVVRNVH
jgi:aspartate/tyrosine/aromatic aminotransferase